MRIPADLSSARVLISNDDGIHAPGLAVLEEAIRAFTDDVWVVAPESEQSGVAHSLTLHLPLRLRQLSERRYAVSGTPTDCVLLGTREIVPRERPPTLVLSGVNRGANVAEDVTYSGTIAAAMEASLLGFPAVAFSQHFGGDPGAWETRWDTAARYVPEVLRMLAGTEIPRGHLVSVNLPNAAPEEVRGICLAPQGQRAIAEKLVKRLDPKGTPYYWIGGVGFDTLEDHLEGSDHVRMKAGWVTVTPLQLDLTAHTMLAEMEARLSADPGHPS